MFIIHLHHSDGFIKLRKRMILLVMPVNGMGYSLSLINQTSKNY